MTPHRLVPKKESEVDQIDQMKKLAMKMEVKESRKTRNCNSDKFATKLLKNNYVLGRKEKNFVCLRSDYQEEIQNGFFKKIKMLVQTIKAFNQMTPKEQTS